MTALEQVLLALIPELVKDLAPLVAKLFEAHAAGKNPLDVLADENVLDTIPAEFRTAVVMAAQKAKYGEGA